MPSKELTQGGSLQILRRFTFQFSLLLGWRPAERRAHCQPAACKNAAGGQSLLSKITRRPIPPPISRRENWKVKRRKIRRLPTCLISLSARSSRDRRPRWTRTLWPGLSNNTRIMMSMGHDRTPRDDIIFLVLCSLSVCLHVCVQSGTISTF